MYTITSIHDRQVDTHPAGPKAQAQAQAQDFQNEAEGKDASPEAFAVDPCAAVERIRPVETVEEMPGSLAGDSSSVA